MLCWEAHEWRGFEGRQGCLSIAQSRKLIRACGSMISHCKHIHPLTLSTVVPDTEITKLGNKRTHQALFHVSICLTSSLKSTQKAFVELATPHSSLGFSGGGCACWGRQFLGGVKEVEYQRSQCLKGKWDCTPVAVTLGKVRKEESFLLKPWLKGKNRQRREPTAN